MFDFLSTFKQKKKISGWLLTILPLVIALVLISYNVFINYNNSNLSLILNIIIFILAILYIIFLPLGIVLIVSASRDPKFNISEIFGFGYRKMKENFWFFAAVLIIYYFITFSPIFLEKIISWALESTNQNEFILKLISSITFAILWALQMIVSIGLVKIALSVTDNKDFKVADLFSVFSRLLDFIIASILYGLIIIGGFILFIVPGIIWKVKFSMFPYFIIEGFGPIKSLKKSAEITNGAKADIFLLLVLFGLLNMLGTLFLFVGLFITMPISAIGMAYVYRKLEILPKTETI